MQKQEELAEYLRVTQGAISKRLKAAGYIQKHRIVTGDPLRQPQAQKIICETRRNCEINGKVAYSWCEGNALYLVGSKACAVL